MEYRKISKEELKDILEKHEKWLNTQNGGERANLENADLENANLIYANLRNANLRYANLRNADLSFANLSFAYLENADLENADLTEADLRDTDLRNADLENANLEDANLRYTNLRNANLIDAKIYNTDFCGVIGKTIISTQLKTSVNNRVINYIPEIDWISAGCFHGTLEDLKNRVKDVYRDNEKIRKRYEKAIELIEFLKEDTQND